MRADRTLASVASLVGAIVLAVAARPAAADIADWQLTELATNLGGDPAARYVELFNEVGGCLFPSSQIQVFDAAGQPLGQAALVASTQCFPAGAYILVATTAAEAALGTTADRRIVPALPAAAGQLCFVSSTTRYDCARWGGIVQPVADLFGPGDATSAIAPQGGAALSRIATTHVVSADWDLLAPTPRGPSDGTPPPDAGALDAAPADAALDAAPADDALPDAAPDAGPVDARPDPPRDAARDARNSRFLDLDARGGACACRVGKRTPEGGPGGAIAWLVGLAALVGCRRRRSRARRRVRANPSARVLTGSGHCD